MLSKVKLNSNIKKSKPELKVNNNFRGIIAKKIAQEPMVHRLNPQATTAGKKNLSIFSSLKPSYTLALLAVLVVLFSSSVYALSIFYKKPSIKQASKATNQELPTSYFDFQVLDCGQDSDLRYGIKPGSELSQDSLNDYILTKCEVKQLEKAFHDAGYSDQRYVINGEQKVSDITDTYIELEEIYNYTDTRTPKLRYAINNDTKLMVDGSEVKSDDIKSSIKTGDLVSIVFDAISEPRDAKSEDPEQLSESLPEYIDSKNKLVSVAKLNFQPKNNLQTVDANSFRIYPSSNGRFYLDTPSPALPSWNFEPEPSESGNLSFNTSLGDPKQKVSGKITNLYDNHVTLKLFGSGEEIEVEIEVQSRLKSANYNSQREARVGDVIQLDYVGDGSEKTIQADHIKNGYIIFGL